jgi:hypothetical protein
MSLAALQRHRLREKLGALCLEPAPPSAAFSFSCPSASTSAAPSNKQQAKTTMPFPDPTRSHLGLENMTQTFIDNDDGVISPERQDGNTPTPPQPQSDNTTNMRRLSLSTVRKMPQRLGKKRISSESATPHRNPAQHLGNVYDEQLERRAGNSSKSKRRKRSASSTRKSERGKESRGRMNVNSSLLLNPVKRCLYGDDDEEEEEKLLTPVKYVDGNHETDDEEEEDPFTTIGHYLPLIE